MGDGTKIEWTDATWNPLVGCSKASAGCDNCYAIRVAHRGMSPQHRGLTVVPEGTTTPEWNGRVNLVPGLLDQPIRWKRPRLIFVNSLSDLWHPEVALDYIEDVFAAMALAPQHVFQLLTKRPKRQAQVLSSDAFPELVEAAIARLEGPAAERARASFRGLEWPLPNLWVGTSVEDNRVAWRADALRETPAAVRWISAEPMIGPLDQLDLAGIDWMVAGGESGPGSRPLDPAWLRELRDRCASYGCPRCRASFALPLGATCEDHNPQRGPAFHFKQWGDWLPVPVKDDPEFSGGRVIDHPNGGRRAIVIRERSPKAFTSGETRLMEPGESNGLGTLLDPDTLAVRVGKGKAGRELDGRTWDEWPAGFDRETGWAPEAGTRNAS